MKRTITKEEFVEEMQQHTNSFTKLGLEVLYDYYETITDDLGQEVEFDPIDITLNWKEYKSIEEAAQQTGYSIQELNLITTVIEFSDGVLIKGF